METPGSVDSRLLQARRLVIFLGAEGKDAIGCFAGIAADFQRLAGRWAGQDTLFSLSCPLQRCLAVRKARPGRSRGLCHTSESTPALLVEGNNQLFVK